MYSVLTIYLQFNLILIKKQLLNKNINMASGQVKMLQLYRNLIREAKNWNAYNYREYALRKIRHEFRINKSIDNEEVIADFYKKGVESLEMIKRQSTIGKLYSTRPLIIENQNINKSSVKKSL